MSQKIKRLYRSLDDARLAGVCGGLGQFLGLDSVVVRLLWVGVTCITGVVPGLLAYAAAWLIVPTEPRPVPVHTPTEQSNEGTV